MVSATEYPVDSPASQMVEYSRRAIDVYDEAEAQGRASVALEGKMIDIPVYVRVQRLFGRAERIAAMEARKRAALAARSEAV